jgi:hypothetical protein
MWFYEELFWSMDKSLSIKESLLLFEIDFTIRGVVSLDIILFNDSNFMLVYLEKPFSCCELDNLLKLRFRDTSESFLIMDNISSDFTSQGWEGAAAFC